MTTVSINSELSFYSAKRPLALLMVPIMLCPFILIGWMMFNTYTSFSAKMIGSLILLGSLLLLTTLIWWAFGKKFKTYKNQEKRISESNTQIQQLWFTISTQRWVSAPRSEYDNTPTVYWCANIHIGDNILAVMIDIDSANNRGLSIDKIANRVRFPKARYSDSDGKLMLNAQWGNVEFDC